MKIFRLFRGNRMRQFIAQGCERLPLALWDLRSRFLGVRKTTEWSHVCLTSHRDRTDTPGDEFDFRLLNKALEEQIFPFWAKHAIDRGYGGYIVHLDRSGAVYDYSRKFAAMQARMIYAFSVGAELFPASGYRALAEHGVDFLFKYFWDQRHDGWFRTVHRDGSVLDNRKHMFDQSYVLIGLCQYYHLSGDKKVFDYLVGTYDVLEKKAWDHARSGYHELFKDDWSVQWRIKTACAQMDALAAVLQLEMAIGGDAYRRKISELAAILINRMRETRRGFILEHFSDDWRYLPSSCRDQIEFGHNLKTAWVLMRAYAIFHDAKYLEAAKELVDVSLAYGWDNDLGGFYQDGFRDGAIACESKLWWPECEGLLALARLSRLTGEEKYVRACVRLAGFIDAYFYDHEYGEMFTSLQKDGTSEKAEKGGDYKAAFHTVEAFFWAAHDMADVLTGKK